MLMPNKITKPVDSLFSIASFILRIIKKNEFTIDELFIEINKTYYKKITIEELLLSLNFLYLIEKTEVENEIIKIKL